jgi:hypothetical protein
MARAEISILPHREGGKYYLIVEPRGPFAKYPVKCRVINQADCDAIHAWAGGQLIQDALPDWTPDQREELMTGLSAAEWKGIFGPAKEEN